MWRVFLMFPLVEVAYRHTSRILTLQKCVKQVQIENKRRNKSRVKKGFVCILLNYMKCWRGKNKLWGSMIRLWTSIIQFMEHHFKLCSSLCIVRLHHHLQKSMNNPALKLDFMELHNLSNHCIIIYTFYSMGWVGLFLNWLHTEVFADHTALILLKVVGQVIIYSSYRD